MKKWDMKTWVIVALGGVAVVAGAAFIMQSKHAALGRQVHRNVTKFLVDHGSQVHSGIISGGLVSTPMKTNVAVNSTVVSMLNSFADQMAQNSPIGGAGGSSPDMQQEQPVSTGIGGVQGRNASGSDLRPRQGSPQPVSSSSPRGTKPPADVVRNPTETLGDDGGYGQQGGRTGDVKGSEYNPEEFTPRGQKPSENVDLFAGDGIPSSSSSSSSAVQAGYE
jgi:hypothetical protein